jgi:hypothetical protein
VNKDGIGCIDKPVWRGLNLGFHCCVIQSYLELAANWCSYGVNAKALKLGFPRHVHKAMVSHQCPVEMHRMSMT